MTLTGMLFAVASFSLLFNYIQKSYAFLTHNVVLPESVQNQLLSDLHGVLIRVGFFAAIFIILTMMLGLFMSHKTAGPLYQLARVIIEIRGGKRDARIRFRPDDDYKELGLLFNQMMDEISGSPKK